MRAGPGPGCPGNLARRSAARRRRGCRPHRRTGNRGRPWGHDRLPGVMRQTWRAVTCGGGRVRLPLRAIGAGPVIPRLDLSGEPRASATVTFLGIRGVTGFRAVVDDHLTARRACPRERGSAAELGGDGEEHGVLVVGGFHRRADLRPRLPVLAGVPGAVGYGAAGGVT